MYAGTAAAAAIGGTGASGAWLFSYNKENFGNDSGMRFGRFMMARGNANAQVSQYREDIAGIVGTTVTKCDAWTSVTTLFLAVGAALSCAGRIGMHGCAPPGWYCALFSGSIFMSIMFNGVALWFSMHASMRAQCAATSLLTRTVRLPIPSMGQLDQARVFASAFEKQPARDMFRVPFMRHPNEAPDMPHYEEETKGKKSKKHAMHDPQKEFGSTTRDTVPSWIRDEVVVDKGDGFMGDGKAGIHEPDEVPEHFKLLMKAQEEWRDYDVYARISMLYGVCSFLYAVTYFAVGYAIVELRGFWAMWSLPMVFMGAQMLIMRLDILKTGQHRLPNVEFLGHLAPYFAVTACTLEYRYFYSESSVALAYGFALLAQFSQFAMCLRWLDLAWPDEQKPDMPEEPGRQWWPGSWQVPSAFTKHLWIITPPKKLDPAVSPCLMHEMEDMAAHGGGFETITRGKTPAGKDKKGMMTAEADEFAHQGCTWPFQGRRCKDQAWQLMRVVILTACAQWFFAMLATSAEIILGPESLMKPPGEPPWIRDTKYRHFTPAMVHLSGGSDLPENYRLFSASMARYTDEAAVAHGVSADLISAVDYGSHGATASAGGHRRLANDGALEELLKLVPELGELVEKATAASSSQEAGPSKELPQPVSQPKFMASSARVQSVAWPALFEPKLLLCAPKSIGQNKIVALTPRGVGAIVPVAEHNDEQVHAETFALDGLNMAGKIAGAAWTQQGLRLITSVGKMLQCDGHSHTDGRWPCQASEHAPLPIPAGSELVAAAFKELPEDAKAASQGPLVALVLKNFPNVAALYRSIDGVWHPESQVHVPPHSGSRPGLSFDGDDLLITLNGGEVHRRPIARGAARKFHASPADGTTREFCSACAAGQGKLLRLALRQGQSSAAWKPELITMS
mmetsp:Transcript_25678/g.65231  ORF Transcript_25678/g.65231 Transcript_25678/m.65231 type:complete len:908 (-) Transcript_25678:130-2853(-)